MNRVKSMSISFERTNWVNNSAPAITAAQLNRMEKGISDCVEAYNTIPTVYKFKGTLQHFSDLPTDNNEIGDVYNILDDGYNYAWNGNNWQFLNISIDLTPFLQEYIVEQGTVSVELYDAESKSLGVSMPVRYRVFSSGLKEIFFSQNNKNFVYLSGVNGMYAAFKTSDLPFSISKCICSLSSISDDNASLVDIGSDISAVNFITKLNRIELFTHSDYHSGYRMLNGYMIFE